MKRALVILAACGTDPATPPGEASILPDDWATFAEVRNCRSSSDHDLDRIRVVADPAARPIYTSRTGEFPLGATIVKPEYDFGDTTCTGEIVQWTVMQKIEGTEHLGYKWQRLDATGKVVTTDDARCYQCHGDCVGESGFAGTCAVP